MQQIIFGNARCGLCGFALLIVSYALFIFNPVEIIKSAKMKFYDGSYAYELWKKPPVKVFVHVYIFNITNKDRFLAGEDDKLNVQEIGPYVYWEELENTNSTFNKNDTITYIPRRKLHFDLSSSIGDPETDRITIPNIPLLGFSSMLTSSPMFVNLVFNSLVEYLDSKPILNLTVKEFLWGYDDQLVKMASNVLPTWINFARFGLLDRMLDEGTNVITMAVPTERQSNRPYAIDNFNGSPVLRQWVNNNDLAADTDKCSLNRATEGILFPRHMTTDMSFPVYRKAFCRTLPLTYTSTGKMPEGYQVYMYKFRTDVFNSSRSENSCYCPKDGCLPAGLSDISPCYYNIPVAVSFPHFYGGDPSLVHDVNGISPDEKKHESIVAVQPDLGIPLAVNIKLQLNVIIKPNRYVKRSRKFTGLTLPVCWLHMEVEKLPDSLNALLYLCFNVGPPLVKVAVALLAAAGFCLVGLSVRRFGRDHRRQNQPAQQPPPTADADYDADADADADGESGGLIVRCERPPAYDKPSAYNKTSAFLGNGWSDAVPWVFGRDKSSASGGRTRVPADVLADVPASYLVPLHIVPTPSAATAVDADEYAQDFARSR